MIFDPQHATKSSRCASSIILMKGKGRELIKAYISEVTYGLEDQILHKMELIDQLIPSSARYDPENIYLNTKKAKIFSNEIKE
jgi:hypothetical protein